MTDTNEPTLADLLRPGDWFRVQHEDGTRTATVHIYGTIGSSVWWDDVASPQLVRELDALDVDDITVYVNSPGGYANDGVAIMNALARNKAHVVAHVDGYAASAASVVILGADEIVMGAGSQLMIHDAWNIAIGQASELEKAAARLDKLSQLMAGLYAQRAGGTVDEWRKAMVEETWYTADEAVDAGLADRVDTLPTATDDDARNVIPIATAARAFGWQHAGRAAASAPFIPGSGHRNLHAAAAAVTLKLPSSTEPGDPNRKDEAVAYSDLQAGLRERLGVTDADASDATLLAAVDEALAETSTTPTATLPEGVVAIESAQLEQLRADATAGRQARDEQVTQARTAAVDDAIRTGRVAPARREYWLSALEADPGAAETLSDLQPGLIPLDPKGVTGGIDEASDEDASYSKLFPQTQKEG